MGEAIVVVANSARLLTEIARTDGFEVIALDRFGDRDTRGAACAWHDVGSSAGLDLDAERILATLASVAGGRDALGWVAGSGFDGKSDLLQAGAELLPLLGNTPQAVASVRDPRYFFARLSALGIAHPETRCDPPGNASGWLFKDAHACGGWHVCAAKAAPADKGRGAYYQREVRGVPHSMLFLADGRQWRALGCARQLVRPVGHHRHVFHGCVGPVALPPSTRCGLAEMLDRLVPEFGLRGLNGLDFMLLGNQALVLELNPRPTATLALFEAVVPGGALRAHAGVCRGGALPAFEAAGTRGGAVGSEIVYARGKGVASAAFSDWLCGRAWSRDRPMPGAAHEAGSPLCSVLARADSPCRALALLAQRRVAVLDAMERWA